MSQLLQLIEAENKNVFDSELMPKYIYASRNFRGESVDYPYIRTEFIKNFKQYVDKYAEGNDDKKQNRWSSYYRNRLSDDTWTCLRIADHDPNVYMTYYKFTRDLTPTQNPFGNICLMFYGNDERSSGRKYALKEPLRLIVKNEDVERFKPFDYTVYHYYSSIMTKKNIQQVINATNEWFTNEGKEEFKNPLTDMCYNISAKKFVTLNPLAQVMYGTVKIILDSKEAVNEMNVFIEGKFEDIIFAYLDIVDENNNIIDTGKIIYAVDKLKVYKEIPSKRTLDDVISDNEIEYHERLKKDLGVL